jgi:hypothetical protein
MTVLDLFSKRQKRRSGGVDVYRYDNIPRELRVQIIQIWHDAFGMAQSYPRNASMNLYIEIVELLRREYGVFSLTSIEYDSAPEELANFLLSAPLDRFLDTTELTFRVIENCTTDQNLKQQMMSL